VSHSEGSVSTRCEQKRGAAAIERLPRPRVRCQPLISAFQPGVVCGGGFTFAALPVLFAHLIMDNGVPGCFALAAGDVMFARPTAQPQLFDQVRLRHYTTCHNPFLNNGVHLPMVPNGTIPFYIGRCGKFKEGFAIRARIPARAARIWV